MDPLPFDHRVHSARGDALDIGGHRHLDARIHSLARARYDGGRQRMVAVLFDRQSDGKQFILARPRHRDDVGQSRLAFSERSGLVKSDRVERAEVLQRSSTFDQNTAAGCARDAAQHGARHRDRQSAGARRDQHRHRPIETVGKRLVDHHPGQQQQDDQRQHERHEDPFEAFGELLSRRTLGLRLGHHRNDARHG